MKLVNKSIVAITLLFSAIVLAKKQDYFVNQQYMQIKLHMRMVETFGQSIWLDGIIYFLSDRTHTSNIWSYNTKTKAVKNLNFTM